MEAKKLLQRTQTPALERTSLALGRRGYYRIG